MIFFLMARAPPDSTRPATPFPYTTLFRSAYNDPLGTEFWQPARSDARGVVRYDPARAQNGLTLYTSGHDQRAFLIDMDGRVVHEWALAYSQIWDESAAVDKPRPDPFIYIEKAHVFRSEERRVGKRGVSTCRSRGVPNP